MLRDYNGYNYDTFFSLNLIFAHKSSKKWEKKAGTNFVLLPRSRKMIGLIKKHDWMIHENLFT